MPRSASGAQVLDGAVLRAAPSLREARKFCARLAREHYENFPVASLLLPRRVRPAVQAIYAFARIADDFADEEAHEGCRLQRLDEWEGMLARCFRGEAIHPVFVALRDAIARHDLPPQPFDDLMRAFRMDVSVHRYADFDALLGYCRLSADPVGRLVLHLAGVRDTERLRRSDSFCTALQLTNHWQDVDIDLGRDRIYLPAADRERFGVGEDDLRARRPTEGFRALMGEMLGRTRALFADARPLCDAVSGPLRLELRLTWLGGRRILDRIEAAGFEVFRRRPKLGAADALPLLWRAWRWTR
jgi:phytoene synthase